MAGMTREETASARPRATSQRRADGPREGRRRPAPTHMPDRAHRWLPPIKRPRGFCLLLLRVSLAATLDCSNEHPNPEAEDSQVEDHLHGYDEAGQLNGRDDVSEADRGEDGDREVQRICPGERLHIEVTEIGLSHQKVGGCEQKQEQWRGGCERFDRPNRRVPSFDDRSDLVDRQAVNTINPTARDTPSGTPARWSSGNR